MVCVVRDFLTGEDKEVVFSADHFPLWYKRAADQVPGTFVYSLPFGTGDYTLTNSQFHYSSNLFMHCTMIELQQIIMLNNNVANNPYPLN